MDGYCSGSDNLRGNNSCDQMRGGIASLDESGTRARYYRACVKPSAPAAPPPVPPHTRSCDVLPSVRSRTPLPPSALKLCRVHRSAGCAAPPLLHTWSLDVSPTGWTRTPLPPSALKLCRVHRSARCAAPPLCAKAIQIALIHADVHGWRTQRHVAHNTTDFAVQDCPELSALIAPMIATTVLPQLTALFFDGSEPAPALTVHDLFFVKYDAEHQASLGPHRDGSIVSFSVAMNSPADFDGGGTFFAHGEKASPSSAKTAASAVGRKDRVDDMTIVRPTAVGDLVLHSGKLVHGGVIITAGVRYILVGFVKAKGGVVDEAFMSSMSCAQARIDPELDWPILCGAVGGSRGGGVQACGLPWATELFKPDSPFVDVINPYS